MMEYYCLSSSSSSSSNYMLAFLILWTHSLFIHNARGGINTPAPLHPATVVNLVRHKEQIHSTLVLRRSEDHIVPNHNSFNPINDTTNTIPSPSPSPSLMHQGHGQIISKSRRSRRRIRLRRRRRRRRRRRELLLLPTLKELATTSRVLTVNKHGSKGNFKSIQSAVDSIPDYNQHWVYIMIYPGVYYEKVTIPYNKPYIAFQGAGRSKTVISWTDRASSFGTANSATFTVNSPSFIAKGVGFRNAAPPPSPGAYGAQAVAVLLNGDMMAFYECGFYGAQDTLFDYSGRHYFKDCYIQGSIDFIFGHGQSFYKGCQLVVTAQSGYLSGSITAHNRNSPDDEGGFVFVGCSIVGTGEVYLGRAWGAYSRVVFLYTYMSSIIVPDGWYDWGQPSRQGTVFYGQYKCTGPGSNTKSRVGWSHELTDSQAQPFLQLSFINAETWLQET